MHMELDRKYNDPKDPNRVLPIGSDHYNFAKKWRAGNLLFQRHAYFDYHRPTDTVDKINFNLMDKELGSFFYTAYDMANRAAMLKGHSIKITNIGINTKMHR